MDPKYAGGKSWWSNVCEQHFTYLLEEPICLHRQRSANNKSEITPFPCNYPHSRYQQVQFLHAEIRPNKHQPPHLNRTCVCNANALSLLTAILTSIRHTSGSIISPYFPQEIFLPADHIYQVNSGPEKARVPVLERSRTSVESAAFSEWFTVWCIKVCYLTCIAVRRFRMPFDQNTQCKPAVHRRRWCCPNTSAAEWMWYLHSLHTYKLEFNNSLSWNAPVLLTSPAMLTVLKPCSNSDCPNKERKVVLVWQPQKFNRTFWLQIWSGVVTLKPWWLYVCSACSLFPNCDPLLCP